MQSLPFLTAELPGVGGVIKQRPEDFVVHEIPLYEPSGAGEHVYCEIEKTGVTTFDAVDRIASALGVGPRDIGYAGLKDANAVTRQWLSIWGTDEASVMQLKIPGIRVLWAMRHGNKLRLGHLAGNRFTIQIRQVEATHVLRVGRIMEEIKKRGMPNYFGEQRFGRRGDNDALGAAVIRGDARALLGRLLGHPIPDIDDEATRQARAAFDAGNLAEAMRLYPRRHGMERRVLARLIKTKRPSAAVFAIDRKLTRLWVSALQSRVFNDVVGRRIGSLDRVLAGDLAWKHDSGAVFAVENAEVEQERCRSLQISPSGPLLGYRMSTPSGEPLAIEQSAFAASELAGEDFRRAGRMKIKGARRPLRVPVTDAEFAGGVDDRGPHITVSFTLPPGAFGTVLLREIMKPAMESAGDEPASDERVSDESARDEPASDDAAADDNAP